MGLKFNIDRPKVSEEEIKKNQNFDQLVLKFKEQSIKQAKGDESWWKNKSVRYATVIAGVTVVCTITYNSLFKKQQQNITNDKTNTSQTLIITENKIAQPQKGSAIFRPPLSKTSPAYSTYKINNAKGGTIKHGNSKIVIGSNSFVDKKGQQIVGDVTIEYREIHSTADIITSGISMTYDSAGHSYQLETAGMFDIKGSKDNDKVFIAPDKKVEVQLASLKSEQKFNQYIFDSITHNWIYLRKDPALVISDARKSAQPGEPPIITQLQHRLNVVIPRASDSVSVVYQKKAEKLPKLKSPLEPKCATPKRKTFKLDGSNEEFPELAGFNNVLFEVGSENTNYTNEFNEITWSDIKVSPGPDRGINYKLTLTYRNRIENLIVYPVLSGADLAKAKVQYNDKLKEYERLLEKRKTDEKKLIAELETKQSAYLQEQKKLQSIIEAEREKIKEQMRAMSANAGQNTEGPSQAVKATRIFRISLFGVYNSDCPHDVPKGNELKPLFIVLKENKPLRPNHVYLIDHTNKTVFDLPYETGFAFKFDEQSDYSLCVFQKEKVFIADKNEFKKQTQDGGHQFEARELQGGADNYAEFRKQLDL